MADATIALSARIAGLNLGAYTLLTSDGVAVATPTPPKAAAGVLTTRTDNDTGVVTAAGHGLTTDDTAMLTWIDPTDGVTRKHRYDVDITAVNGAAVSVDIGAGDNLPAAQTVVNIALQVEANVVFDPDDLLVLAITANVRGVIVLVDVDDGIALALDLPAGAMAFWSANSGLTRPVTNKVIDRVRVGAGDVANDFLPVVATLYDATP
jgi:hypothetical protein